MFLLRTICLLASTFPAGEPVARRIVSSDMPRAWVNAQNGHNPRAAQHRAALISESTLLCPGWFAGGGCAHLSLHGSRISDDGSHCRVPSLRIKQPQRPLR